MLRVGQTNCPELSHKENFEPHMLQGLLSNAKVEARTQMMHAVSLRPAKIFFRPSRFLGHPIRPQGVTSFVYGYLE